MESPPGSTCPTSSEHHRRLTEHRVSDQMETTAHPNSAQAKTLKNHIIFLTLFVVIIAIVLANPHAPKKLTWQVLSAMGDVVWSVSNLAPEWTWWPHLTPDLCQLVAGLDTWDVPTVDPREGPPICKFNIGISGGIGGWGYGCSHPLLCHKLKTLDLYACPRNGRNQETTYRCGGADYYYCASWGCETSGTTYWKPSSNWDLISVGRWAQDIPCSCSNFTCNLLNITFTEKGK